MAFPIAMVAIWVGVTVLQYLLAKQLEPSVAKRGPGDLQAPIAEQGHPVPVVFGTVHLKGPNCVWFEAKPQQDNDGNWTYYASLMLAICHGKIDRVRRVWIGQGEKLPKATKVLGSSGYPLHSAIGTTPLTSTNSPPLTNFRPSGLFVVGTNPVVVYEPDEEDSYPERNNWWIDNSASPNVPPVGAYITWKGYDYPGSWEPIVTMPAVGDTVILDGITKRWTGTAWEEPASFTWSGTEWNLSINDEQSAIVASGAMRIYDGAADQPTDANLAVSQGRASDEVPAFGGLCYAVFSKNLTQFGDNGKFYWGKSPQIPAVSFEVERCPDPLGVGDSLAAIECATLPDQLGMPPGSRDAGKTYNANPAFILLDLLMNPVYGLGVALADIDQDSFLDAARIMVWESFGMSMLLDSQSPFDDVAGDILKTIDGVLFPDVASGKWQLRIVRPVYTTTEANAIGLTTSYYTRTDWPSFSDDDMLDDPEYSRTGWGDVANEVKVQFIDATASYAQRVVQVQDLANWTSQNGETVSVCNVFNGVNTRELAIKLAYRELKTFGYPRSHARITLNRKAWALRPGDCLVFNSTALGISNMKMRIGDVRYGTLTSPSIVVEAIEDVFSLPDTGYVPPDSGWVDPSTIAPVAPSAVRAWELAYDVTRDGPRVGFAALAVRGDQYTTGATVWGKINNGQFMRLGEIGYTPSAMLNANIAQEELTTSITLQGAIDFDSFMPNGDPNSGENLLLIDDELIAFQGISFGSTTVTISGLLRGVMDTLPRIHYAGARVWLIRRPPPVQNPGTIANHSEIFGVVASNQSGELDPYATDLYGGMTNSRELRPFVPGRFRVGQTALTTGTFTDTRDGKVYKTVLMPDGKWWSAENLAWDGAGIDRENNPANRALCGKLYTWSQSLYACPPDTHLPSNAEWTAMEVSLGGYYGVNSTQNTSGYRLKSKSMWDVGIEGSDVFGFGVLAVGNYLPSQFNNYLNAAMMWTSTSSTALNGWSRIFDSNQFITTDASQKAYSFSVRFIVDSGNIPDLTPSTEMGELSPSYVQAGDIDLFWANRNRLTQAPGVLSQQASSVPMEIGQTNRVKIRKGTEEAFTLALNYDSAWHLEPSFGVQHQFVGAPPTWGGVYCWKYWGWNVTAPGEEFKLFVAAPSFTTTVYYYYTIDGRSLPFNDYNGGPGTLGYSYSVPNPNDGIQDGRVYICRGDWVNNAGNMAVTLTDLRNDYQTTIQAGLDSTVESYAVTPAQINLQPYDAKSPQSISLLSERDGLTSMETRKTQLIFEAGYGMAYGLSYGGA